LKDSHATSVTTPNKQSTLKTSVLPKEDLKHLEDSIKRTYHVTGKEAPNLHQPNLDVLEKTRKERDDYARRCHELENENHDLHRELDNAKNTINNLQYQINNKPKYDSPHNPLHTETSPQQTISPIQKNKPGPVIQPLTQSVSHFDNHDAYKQCKGVLVQENHNLIQHINNHRERVGCLKNKAHLFENDWIQVGVSSSIVRDTISRKNQARFVIFFGNKTNQTINNFHVDYVHDQKSLLVHPVPFKVDGTIPAGEQIKQTVTISLGDTKTWEVTCQGHIYNTEFSFAIPLTILKFIDYKPTNSEEFRHKWKLRDIFVMRTVEFDPDESLIQSIEDFKKYFPSAVELHANKSKKTKYGIIFDLDNPNGDYLLRVNILPNSKVVFQIASYDNIQDRVATVLQTLVSLFKAN